MMRSFLSVFVLFSCFDIFWVCVVSETIHCDSGSDSDNCGCTPSENDWDNKCALHCSHSSGCQDASLSCSDKQECKMTCSSLNSCANTIFHSMQSQHTLIECTDDSSCIDSVVYCPNDDKSKCIIKCHGSNSCKNMVVYASNAMQLNLECTDINNKDTDTTHSNCDSIIVYCSEQCKINCNNYNKQAICNNIFIDIANTQNLDLDCDDSCNPNGDRNTKIVNGHENNNYPNSTQHLVVATIAQTNDTQPRNGDGDIGDGDNSDSSDDIDHLDSDTVTIEKQSTVLFDFERKEVAIYGIVFISLIITFCTILCGCAYVHHSNKRAILEREHKTNRKRGAHSDHELVHLSSEIDIDDEYSNESDDSDDHHGGQDREGEHNGVNGGEWTSDGDGGEIINEIVEFKPENDAEIHEDRLKFGEDASDDMYFVTTPGNADVDNVHDNDNDKNENVPSPPLPPSPVDGPVELQHA